MQSHAIQMKQKIKQKKRTTTTALHTSQKQLSKYS